MKPAQAKSLPNCPRCRALRLELPHRVRAAGSFRRQSFSNPVKRYQCLECLRTFSDATFEHEYRQRKRHLNPQIFKLLVSNVSMRRTAKLAGVDKGTVERRFSYFGRVAAERNKELLRNIPAIENIVFDDMESYIHTKCKPVSIPMTVDKSTRLILSFDVVSMPAKGLLAEIARKRYGRRADDRKMGWQNALTQARRFCGNSVTILSDSHKSYPAQIRAHIPNAIHRTVLSRRACVAGQGELKAGGWDPMFAFNHTAAMLRANICRLIRKTWCTSKKIKNLHHHIAMYAYWHNETIMAKLDGRKMNNLFAG
jgi:transposase-like protein